MPRPQTDGRWKLAAGQEAALADMRTLFRPADSRQIQQIGRGIATDARALLGL
jgi:hypothetical protein